MIEQQLITAILEGKITADDLQKRKFTSDFMPILGDVLDWIIDYTDKNNTLPSVELVKTKSAVYQPVQIQDNPIEILDALKKRHAGNYLEKVASGTVRIYRKTEDVQKALDYLEQKIALINADDDEEDLFELSSENFKLGQEDYALRRKAVEGQGYYGIPTGFGTQFDEYLNGGWLRGNLYGLVGSTGVGKSWMAQAASRGALRYGKTVLYVALEGIVVKEYYRFLTMITGEAENNKLQAGQYSMDEFMYYQNRMREYVTSPGGRMFLSTFGKRQRYTPKILERKIRQSRPDFVIVDYGTMMSVGRNKENWIDFMDVTKSVKTLISRPDINLPLLMLLQGSISDNNEKFVLQDIAQSKGMARDFDEIVGVTKVAGRKYTIRLNSDKARDTEGGFDALYQTNWNTGVLEYLQNVSTGDETF